MESPYDEWSEHIHAVITFLQPFFDDWRSYASMVSALLGVGVLIMENQVLLRMRMGRWEILGYILWCAISSVLGPVFDIIVMLGLLAYCRQKSNRMQITNETIAKALLPAPVASNYRIMGAVCATATVMTLCSNVLYMFRGWEEPLSFYDWASNCIRWLTSQIWYAIGMIFLFHVVTRPAQSGVVLFGKFPRDLWACKWQLCVLYIPVHYLLLKLCFVHKDSKHILIPLEIVVDVVLYNGPFLVILLRLLYWAWKVAYDEAILTGAIYEDEEPSEATSSPSVSGLFFIGDSRPGSSTTSTTRPGTSGYVGLAMVDLDEAEQGQSRVHITVKTTTTSRSGTKSNASSTSHKAHTKPSLSSSGHGKDHQKSLPKLLSPPRQAARSSSRMSPKTSPKTSSPLRNVVIFSVDSSDDETDEANEDDEAVVKDTTTLLVQ
ncbi:hypothetical protein BGZ74_005638 [Mortierella antarctica]|nr:hypothetical protein BGZ74_005638 [Mortierella antarctica]